ncbi:DUF2804 domain-containing protein [Thermodesulfobacteriota bacterium]
MNRLVNPAGSIRFGLYDEIVDHVNYEDYRLETPMGWIVPGFLKKFKFNQFHFLGIIGPEVMVGMAVVDLKYLASGFFYVYDRKTGELFDTKKLAFPGRDKYIKPYPETMASGFNSGRLMITMKDRHISAKGEGISLDAKFEPVDPNPLRLCSRAGYNGWVYTQKTGPVELFGEITYNGKHINISPPSYMGLVDWTGGFMRRETFWNWASTACTLEDGRPFGLNLSCGVNETSFTENAFWLDGKMTKLHSINFVFNKNDIRDPWRMSSLDKKVDLVFYPENLRGEKINVLFIASRFTQLIGAFEGQVVSETGERVTLRGCPGWTEDHYAKW